MDDDAVERDDETLSMDSEDTDAAETEERCFSYAYAETPGEEEFFREALLGRRAQDRRAKKVDLDRHSLANILPKNTDFLVFPSEGSFDFEIGYASEDSHGKVEKGAREGAAFLPPAEEVPPPDFTVADVLNVVTDGRSLSCKRCGNPAYFDAIWRVGGDEIIVMEIDSSGQRTGRIRHANVARDTLLAYGYGADPNVATLSLARADGLVGVHCATCANKVLG